MKNARTLFAILLLMFCLTTSCTKEGTGGNSNVSGVVVHHTELITDATVYIKYGATEFPGSSPDDYDDYIVVDTASAFYEFKELKKGTYYLWGSGYDPSGDYDVTAGFRISLEKNADKVINIPVVE